jgi:soluble lytic murein transglycosylase-like protein
LLRRVADEREALNPKPLTPAFQPLPIARFGKAIPRLVLARYSEYRDTFAHILEEEKVPPELLAVALVESGFNPLALSPKGARGIWQLMPATAARYGLAVQPANDHRTHPEHSTRAAARYLRDLYRQFGDWKLALAAYNAGETRVQQIIDRTGIRDFDEMARRGLLPLETRKYVPAVLAAWSQMAGATMTAAPLNQIEGLKKSVQTWEMGK